MSEKPKLLTVEELNAIKDDLRQACEGELYFSVKAPLSLNDLYAHIEAQDALLGDRLLDDDRCALAARKERERVAAILEEREQFHERGADALTSEAKEDDEALRVYRGHRWIANVLRAVEREVRGLPSVDAEDFEPANDLEGRDD